ncbi:MAG: FHA domain-containing protein [Anaerolineae bacterium]
MMDALQPPVQVGWNLILNDGSNATRTIPVDRDTLLIGRADTSDLHLDDAHISRQHARLTRQGDQLIVEDLQTINGTTVNGQALTHPYILQPGDVISLGAFTLSAEKVLIPIRSSSLPPTRTAPASTVPKVGLGLLATGGVVVLIFLAWAGLGLFWLLSRGTQPPATSTEIALKGPIITIGQGPDEGSTLALNRTITIQAVAADSSGVTRLEVMGQLGARLTRLTLNWCRLATLNAGLRWTPTRPGPYALEVRAYNTAKPGQPATGSPGHGSG